MMGNTNYDWWHLNNPLNCGLDDGSEDGTGSYPDLDIAATLTAQVLSQENMAPIANALATVQADVAAEITKANAAIAQAKANNDEGQELQAIEWLFAATQTQTDLIALANDIDPPPPPPPATLQLVAVETQLAQVGTPITDIALGTTGGTAPVTFKTSGLPAGLMLSGGTISGTPTTAGTDTVTVTATDSGSPAQSATMTFEITVDAEPNSAKVIMGAFVNGNTGAAAETFVEGFGGDPSTAVISVYFDGDESTTWADLATNAISNIESMSTWPGPKMLSVLLCNTASPTPWDDYETTSPNRAAWLACWTDILNAAKSHGLTDLRSEWEYNEGTDGFATKPTAAQFVGNYQAVHALKESIYPELRIWFNPASGVAENDTYSGLGPYTAFFPGASGCDLAALDVYTGPNTAYPGGTAPDNGVPWSEFLSGPHVNLDDITNLAKENGLLFVGIGEWGAEGAGYDNPADVDSMMAWAHSCQEAGISVILVVWGNGTWSEEDYPLMWAELKKQVTAARAAGWIA